MPHPQPYRVFLSAVSSEFEHARAGVAADLRARGLTVRDQQTFRQEVGAETTLAKLERYLQECDAVVCIIGRRSGALAEEPAALPYAHLLPPGFTEASYTQWEYLLARHRGKRVSRYVARDDYAPDRAPLPEDQPDLQQEFVRWLFSGGLDRSEFSTADELRRLVLLEQWPDLRATRPLSLPYPSIGTLFKGREEFLQRLRESLRQSGDHRATAIAGRAVHGLGGVGKTRLAVEYAWRHRNDYSAVLFVSAETREQLHASLAALTGPLVLNLAEHALPEEEVRVAAALHWLREHPGWFLILDNVDTEPAAEAVEELVARLAGGQVLITGRLDHWSGWVKRLDLDVLAPAPAAEFLLERADRRRKLPTDAEDAAALAKELDGLALALEQAAAYVNARRNSLRDYLRAWQSHELAVQEWYDARIMKYPRSVAVTWQTTMDQLGPGETALLRLLAWLAPEPLPLWVFDTEEAEPIWHLGIQLLSEETSDPVTAGSLREALDRLADYGMIRRDLEAETVSVHRVVQEIVRTRLPEDQRRGSLELALSLLVAALPGDPGDVRTWPRWELLRPHVAAASDRGEAADMPEPTTKLFNLLGRLLGAKALHVEAEPLFRCALALDERSLGTEHPNVASDLNNLAQLLKATNRLSEAEPMMWRALAIDEQSFGPDHPEVAIDLSNLAALLQTTNRLTEAEPLMRRALAIGEQSLGAEHPRVATHLNNLARLLQDTNRLTEAEPLMRRALAIDEQSFGADHPSTAIHLNNLAQLLQDTNRLGEAEPLMRRALAIDEQSFGPDHPNVAVQLSNLAALLYATNRLEEAEPLMRRGLAIDERSFGADHPKIAIRLNNLAKLLQATNRPTEAEPLMRRMLGIFLEFTRRTGHEHPHLQAAFRNYSELLNAMGQSEAEIQAELVALLAEFGFEFGG